MRKYGLHGSCARLLLVILKKGSITSAQIAKESGRNKAEVSRTISDLEDKGLVKRCGSPTNYRVRLELTDRGKDTAEKINAVAERAVLFTGGSLSEEERATLYKALDLISKNLYAIAQSGIPDSIPDKGENR